MIARVVLAQAAPATAAATARAATAGAATATAVTAVTAVVRVAPRSGHRGSSARARSRWQAIMHLRCALVNGYEARCMMQSLRDDHRRGQMLSRAVDGRSRFCRHKGDRSDAHCVTHLGRFWLACVMCACLWSRVWECVDRSRLTGVHFDGGLCAPAPPSLPSLSVQL